MKKIVNGEEIELTPEETAEKAKRESDWAKDQAKRDSEEAEKIEKRAKLKERPSNLTLKQLTDLVYDLLDEHGYK